MKQYRIGMLTPSANTCLEPVTAQILAQVPEVSAHFSRLRVTHTGLEPAALEQFEMSRFLDAAHLLADAEVDVIAWNGSSGSWLGREFEESLCLELERIAGVPALTTTTALFDAMRHLGIRRYGLVAPFPDDMISAIVKNYSERGFPCDRSVNLPLMGTLEKDRVPAEDIRELIRSCDTTGLDAIAVVCTNFRAAPLVESMEMELGLPVIDSVSATAWKCLEVLGAPYEIAGWGQLLSGRAGAKPVPA